MPSFGKSDLPGAVCGQLKKLERKLVAYGDMLRRIVAERGITQLRHFTSLENLPSIVEHGLRPRAEMEAASAPYLWSDPWRLDGFPDAISLSVTEPNWDMLAAVRDRHPGRHWIVLDIDPQILVGADCRFCAGNAAQSYYAKSWRQFRSLKDFEEMFADQKCGGVSVREKHKLADCQTTDPQAEILFFGTIRPDSIIGAAAETIEVAEFVQGQLDRIGGWERDIAPLRF